MIELNMKKYKINKKNGKLKDYLHDKNKLCNKKLNYFYVNGMLILLKFICILYTFLKNKVKYYVYIKLKYLFYKNKNLLIENSPLLILRRTIYPKSNNKSFLSIYIIQ